MSSPAAGEVLVGVLWASVDPYQRGRMSEARSYAPSLQLGDVITSQSVGRVVETNDPRFSVGDLVVGQLGWQEYAIARAGTLRRVPPELDPATLALHAVGMTGFTAYFGLFDATTRTTTSPRHCATSASTCTSTTSAAKSRRPCTGA